MAATGLLGCGAFFLHQAAFAKELDKLLVTPRPERVTELYFINYRKPLTSLPPGATQKVAFTVHNMEHRTVRYHYRLIARLPDGNRRLLSEDTFTLTNNHSRVTNQTITVPSITGRMAIEVDLDYIGTTFGDTSNVQKQTIRYWIDIEDSQAHA